MVKKNETSVDSFSLQPIGFLRSTLKRRSDAPKQGSEGAPDAVLELLPEYLEGLERVQVGDEIIIITWLHQARNDVLKVHPRNNPATPLTGVFLTRSPDRPNPIGLHRVTVIAIDSTNISIGPIEAIDGTPVIDIKPLLQQSDY